MLGRAEDNFREELWEFTSFIQRDECFDEIQELVYNIYNAQDEEEEDEVNVVENFAQPEESKDP